MKEKDKVVNDAKETIDKVSDTFKVNGDKAKDYISKLDDKDIKFIKELENIVEMFKKPFWKVVLAILIISALLNIFYSTGYLIGQLFG